MQTTIKKTFINHSQLFEIWAGGALLNLCGCFQLQAALQIFPVIKMQSNKSVSQTWVDLSNSYPSLSCDPGKFTETGSEVCFLSFC